MDQLREFYEYFGAHRIPDRDANELQRAAQRCVIAALTPLWLYIGLRLGYGQSSEQVHVFLVAYTSLLAVSSAAYWVYLRRHPGGAIAAQYAFLLTDPFAAAFVYFLEPQIFNWVSVLNVIFVARSGWRFGSRTFWLEWALAVLAGAALSLYYGPSHLPQTIQYSVLMLAGLYLFIPIVRMQEHSRSLLVEQAKMASVNEALRAKSEFLSKIGHEIRTPLQSIQCALEVFESTTNGPEDKKDLIARVRRAALSVSTHVFDLLTLARNDTGNLTLRPQRTDVSELFEAIVEEARDVADLKGLSLTLVRPHHLDVFVDSVRIGQVLENLLSNAVRYTDRGFVRVEVSPLVDDREVLRFEVSDSGRGIKPEDIPVIFSAYERGSSGTPPAESSGIGLAVVKTLVGLMGGEVSVTSTLGAGSSFVVEVPVVRASIARPPGAKRVLIIDDNEQVLLGLSGVVRQLGYQADTAISVGAASNILEAQSYDVVMFDLQMPVKSGTELAKEVRLGNGPNKSARFVAMTAGEDTEAGQGAPFDDFARKPISGRSLRRLLGVQPDAEVTSKPASSKESTLDNRAGLSRF